MGNIWKTVEVEAAKIEDKEKYKKLFAELVGKLQDRKLEFEKEIDYKGDHYIIFDERLGGYFVHLVPEDLYILFRRIQKDKPNSILGFSILCGRHKGKDLRATCFGIPCSDLAKSLIGR